jgi:hypothetical protein
MTMQASMGARRAAGALLLSAAALLAAVPVSAAERVRFAAERPDGGCAVPVSGAQPGAASLVGGQNASASPVAILGIARLSADRTPPADASSCVLVVRVESLDDAALEAASQRLAAAKNAPATILSLPASEDGADRFAYAVKRLASLARSASPEGRIGLDTPQRLEGDLAEELAPYAEARVLRPGDPPPPPESDRRAWVLAPAGAASPADAAISALARFPRAELVAVEAGDRPPTEADAAALSRLQRYFTRDVSPDPTATPVRRRDGGEATAVRYFDAKAFTPILLLPRDPAGQLAIELSGGPFDKASVENLSSGAKKDFSVSGARTLTLDASQGTLAVVLHPASRGGSETRTAVDVGAIRGLTAEEIIARERAWDAGQQELVPSYIATVETQLRFRIASFASSLDLTIRGPYFYERGKPSDWQWQEFFLNGVRWKGRTIPKLPILQPEKVTTLPLEIRLSEEYAYELAGETTIDGRSAYRIDFRPRAEIGDKPAYRGTAWIDKQTFALLRRESIQLNLKGDTLSNVQTEYYRAVPGTDGVVLPLEIRGQQVFSTAGRTTAIERYVVMTDVQVAPPDFEARRKAALASPSQMVRDTDQGLRYLVPDAEHPGDRRVETKMTRRSLFGLTGVFYQTGQDYPFPLLGVQYFDFDLFGKGKQLSVFFGGVLLFANYTDPSFLGTHFDLGVDVFGVALPFTETSYRDGEEVVSEKIKHLPESVQVNMGHPIGPYFKASLGLFSNWDNYQRDSDTGPNFVTPVDTLTNGGELRLAWNQDGYNLTGRISYNDRHNWAPWGDPATSGYDPHQKDYWRYSFVAQKGFYFENFRKLFVKVSYLDGFDLDRFSQWDFGPFGDAEIRGFPRGSLRADRAIVNNLSYGINIENAIRFELLYDQGWIKNPQQGFDYSYFSGAGIATALNGPWENTRIRGEVGIPVVRHGISGFTISAQILKLF